jgi:hypothetical protein
MISLPEFRRRVAAFDGQRLETGPRRLGFTVRVNEKGLEYTPESSGKPRTQSWQSIERVLDRYNETHSLELRQYHDITRHSSYLITLLRLLSFPGERGG